MPTYNKEEVKEHLKRVAGDLYPWSKREVTVAETVGGFEAPDIWMRGIRNGLDHLASATNHFLSNDLEQSSTSLNDAERNFILAAHESWLRCASLLTKSLEDMLNSRTISGSIDLAYMKLKAAKKLMVDARTDYPEDRKKATEEAEKAARLAEEGLKLVRQGTVFESMTFWVSVALLIIGLFSLLLSFTR